MIKIEEFLDYLSAQGIKVSTKNNLLQYDSAENMPADLQFQIRERENEILEFIQKSRPAVKKIIPPIISVPEQKFYPLTPSQKSFWLLEKLIPNNSFSNLLVVVKIKGHINRTVLERAFLEIIGRHESLRLVFDEINGQPVQSIKPVESFALQMEDLSALPEDESENVFFRRAIDKYHEPFNFKESPLMRACLFKLSENEHLLLYTIHHIISDSISLQILNREVILYYQMFSEGLPVNFPQLSVQYPDYAYWQRQLLDNNLLEDQNLYWMQKLDSGTLLPDEIPVDKTRPETHKFLTSIRTLTIENGTFKSLKKLSYRQGCTFFMLVVAIVQTLLHLWSNQKDVRVCSLVSNRNRLEIEGLIGLFLNTVIFRTDFSGDPTLLEILERVSKVIMQGFNNQDLPFEEILRSIEHEVKLNRDTLVRTMVLFEHTPIESIELSGMTLEIMDVKKLIERNLTVTSFDLIFNFHEKSHSLTMSVFYKTHLFEDSTIEKLIEQFQFLVNTIITDPNKKLASLIKCWDET